MDRVPNIGGTARTRRLLLGAFGAAVAAALVWVQHAAGLPRPVRLLALPALLAATYGFFQYREKT